MLDHEINLNYNNIISNKYGPCRTDDDDIINMLPHKYTIYDRVDFTKYDVYSIDPEGCTDADDAFSIYEEDDKLFLIIHIADPTEYINIESDLWTDICKRVVTRYPSNNSPIHMMPTKIIELSSLMDDTNKSIIKNAISIYTEIDTTNYKPIGGVQIYFSIIKVISDNKLSYASASLLHDSNIVLMNGLKISKALQNIRSEHTIGVKLNELNHSYPKYDKDCAYLYTDTSTEIKMKQIIAEFAIFANSFVGEYLKINLNGRGIFRTCDTINILNSNLTGEELLNDIILNGIKATYLSTVSPHDLVGMPSYCHFTSPIRRLSDCICHYLLKYIHLKLNVEDIPFTNKELENYSEICLITTREIKKIQYSDIKYRLIQVIHNMISKNGNVNIKYFIASYSGLFLNIIICNIDNYNVMMSYTLRIKKYDYIDDIKKIYNCNITNVNCFEKFDCDIIPELSEHIINY